MSKRFIGVSVAAMAACAGAGRAAVLNIYTGAGSPTGAFGTVKANGSVDGSAMLIFAPYPPGGIVEGRAIVEFSLASLPAGAIISSASLTVNSTQQTGGAADRVAVNWYAGDGAVTTNDYSAGSTFYTFGAPIGIGYRTLDVTQQILSLQTSGAAYAGFNFRDTVTELNIIQLHPFYYAAAPQYSMCPTLSITYRIAGPYWYSATSGSWNAPANWGNGVVPNGPGAIAQFAADAGTAARTVTLDSDVRVGQMSMNSATYTIAGPGTLTFDSGGTGAATLSASGAQYVSAPIALASDISITAYGNLTVGDIVGPHSASMAGGSKLTVDGVVATKGIYSSTSGGIDFKESSAILTAQTENDIRHMVNYGILTSSDQGDITFLGVITNDDGTGHPLFTTFAGQPAPLGCTLIRFTYFGDTDFNGYVDGTDLANLLAGMNGGLHGWQNGDIDYSGTVDAQDLEYMLGILEEQGKPFPDLSGAGGGTNAVPEPAAAGWLAVAALALGARRRR